MFLIFYAIFNFFWCISIEFIYTLSNRFPIAIKCAQNIGPEKTSLFLDEAKTMLQIGSYHDFIVNLQGIIYNMSNADDQTPEVNLSLIHLLNTLIYQV